MTADAPLGSIVAAGVDGCRSGWIGALRTRAGGITLALFPCFSQIRSLGRIPVAIDIPIGLAQVGARSSDRLARMRLGPRRSSIFPPPPRAALHAASYAEACALRRQIEGKSVSAQAWGIFAKIAEVDLEMTPELQECTIEAHPELAFTMMNGGVPPLYSKKTREGRLERIAALRANLPGSAEAVELRRPVGCAADDLLDALAVLWTAERFTRGEACCLSDQAERDLHGLRMEIWY